MGKDHTPKTDDSSSGPTVDELDKKIQKLENENAVLTDKIESKGDPNSTPRIIRKGFLKSGIKFQKNKEKISATVI